MYSTIADLLKLLPEYTALALADDAGAGSVEDPAVQAVITAAIADADSEIDAYVGTALVVPLSPVPALISKLSTKLAIHNLYLRKAGLDEPENWQRETSRCMRLLESIATGKLALGAEEGSTADPDGAELLVSSPDRIFTNSKWGKF